MAAGIRVRSGWLALAAMVAAGVVAPVRAQLPPDLRGRPVVEVRVEGRTAGATPIREVGVPLGAPLTRRLLRSTVERLVASGRWADVQLHVVPVPGGVRVVAHLVPRLILTRIQIEGNEELDDLELERVMRVAKGTELSRERLTELPTAAQEAYAERGYERATVQVFIRDTDEPSRKVLVVRVHEGAPTRVRKIAFEGEQPPRQANVVGSMDLDEGDVLDRRVLDESLRDAEKQLRERGWLRAELGPVRVEHTEEGAVVHVRSVIGPRFALRLVGIAPLERKDVEEVLRLGEERLSSVASLEALADRIRDLYQRHGFHDAQAHVRAVRGARKGSALLVVRVETGARLQVTSVAFPGARHYRAEFLREQVRSYLQEDLGSTTLFEPVDNHTVERLGLGGQPSRPRQARPPLEVDPTEVYYEPIYAEAVEHLRELYRADGFLGASVGPARLERLKDHRAVVVVPVVEGPRSILHSVELKGNEALTSHDILSASGFERGMPFSHLAVEQARVGILDLYKESGYLYARVEPEVRFSGDRTRAEVILHVVERFPVHVGDIIIRGAHRTSESLIRDRIALRRGELYRPSLARKSQESLAELGVFSAINVNPQDADLPARVKPVVVTVTERKTQLLGWGLGISTGEGARGEFEYGYRNLFAYAVQLRLRAQLAYQFFFFGDTQNDALDELSLADRLERLIAGGISIPHISGLPKVRAAVDGFHQRDNERDFGLDKNGIGVTFTYRPIRRLSISLSENFERNNVDLFVDAEGIEELILNTDDRRLQRLLRVPEGQSKLFATRGSVVLDLRDSPFLPTEGALVSVSAEWVHTLSAGELNPETDKEFFSNHLKLQLTTSGYLPLGKKVVLAGQARIGRIFHLDDRSRTYPNRRFFMGGVDTTRGYLEDAMIPQDLADEILRNEDLGPGQVLRGGDTFALVRAELRFPIYGIIRGGVFTDIGNLWARAGALDLLELRPTAGFGLRLATPVGPVAFDLGFNLMRRRELDERLAAFHFSIGLF